MNESYERVREHYNRMAGKGPYATLAPSNQGGAKSRYVGAVFDAALSRELANGSIGRVLDFGCGTGVFSALVAPNAESVDGVDISDGLLEQARQSYGNLPNVCFTGIDGRTLPFPDNAFDSIVARESVCYVQDEHLDSLFGEFLRVMAPGSRLLLLDQVSRNPYWQRHPKAPFLTKRSPEVIHAVAQRNGFDLIREYTVRTPRFPLVYAAWSGLVPMRWIPGLARMELRFHRSIPAPRYRWWNQLFVFSPRPA